MANADIDGKFNETHRFIISARETLEQGGDVDLGGLDTSVAELCTLVASMEAGVVPPYAKRLQEMMGDLNKVAELLKQRHAEIVRQIEGLNHQKNAAKAYGQALKNADEESGENS
ncbi:hypothetical protein GC177_07570 [bacterium]|nr:hypothetical protein [bacterium]